ATAPPCTTTCTTSMTRRSRSARRFMPGWWNGNCLAVPASNHDHQWRQPMLKFGASMFFTDYSMAPGELGQALEQRGFESVWAPEHSHIPVSRKTPFPAGSDLPKKYYDAMDPFVTLTMAAAATKAMKAIWTQSKAEYHGEFVNFDPMMTWPKPVQKPHPPVIVGGAFPYSARRAIRYGDGWIPQASRGAYSEIADMIPEFRKMATDAGRDPKSIE